MASFLYALKICSIFFVEKAKKKMRKKKRHLLHLVKKETCNVCMIFCECIDGFFLVLSQISKHWYTLCFGMAFKFKIQRDQTKWNNQQQQINTISATSICHAFQMAIRQNWTELNTKVNQQTNEQTNNTCFEKYELGWVFFYVQRVQKTTNAPINFAID